MARSSKIKQDHHTNVYFPHADREGPTGYEIKNKHFQGFAKGGEKALWVSAVRQADTALVITESSIDALSYAALYPDDHARYVSTGGALNPTQPALIRAAIERMGQGSRILIATDNDPAGRALAEQLEALAQETGRQDLQIRRHLPEGAGRDWNDILQENRLQPDDIRLTP